MGKPSEHKTFVESSGKTETPGMALDRVAAEILVETEQARAWNECSEPHPELMDKEKVVERIRERQSDATARAAELKSQAGLRVNSSRGVGER